jgi:hypothetical protein
MKQYVFNYRLLDQEMKRRQMDNAAMIHAIYQVCGRLTSNARVEAWRSGSTPDPVFITAIIEVMGWWDKTAKEIFTKA